MVDLLEFCRGEIANSDQWKTFSQHLFVHIRQHLNASNVMLFTDLSERERLHVTAQASELIKASDKAVFQDILSVVSGTLDKRINEYTSLHKGNRARNDVLMEILAALSSHLLLKWPTLKHLLLQCFNRTLPPVLRASMWQLMLQNKQVFHNFVTKATQVESQDPRSSGYHDYQQCQQLIGSNRRFSALLENRLCLQVMKDVLIFWRLQCGKEYVSQLDILLCIPFVYVRLRELEIIGERNRPNMEQFTGSVCEQYVSFMTQRPPTMMDERLTTTQGAMITMFKRVFQILHGADKTLYQSLKASLVTESSSHSSGEEVFAAQLVPLLHPYVQRLFVGDVSMDVVCFIWDQCFLGLGIGEYQYIPYLITVLLLIMREPLLLCKEITVVSHAILNNLSLVTVQQIQSTIEKHFLTELTSQLKVPKLVASHASFVDPLLEPIPQWSHFVSEQLPGLPSWKELQKQRRDQDEAKKRELQDAKEAAAEARRQHENQVTELQAEVTRLREELAALKVVPQQVHMDQKAPSLQGDDDNKSVNDIRQSVNDIRQSNVISKADALSSNHSSSSPHTTSAPPTPRRNDGSAKDVSMDHVNSPTYSLQTSQSTDTAKQQVQETWLTILGNFTKAVDLVCHGTNDDSS